MMKEINFNKIKELLGIRNRFWRKKIEVLKPKIYRLFLLSIKRNHLPIWVAFSKTINKKNKFDAKQLEIYYYTILMKYLNTFKKYNIILEKDQKAKLVKIKGDMLLVIQNPDGSEDYEKRKKLYEISKKILYILQNENLVKTEKEKIFLKIMNSYLNLYIKEKDKYLEFLESPIGKIFNKIIPGLDILLEIQKYKEMHKEKNFFDWLQYFTKKNLQNFIQGIPLSISKNISKQAKWILYPLAISSEYLLERYQKYRICENYLEKNYQKLLWIKKQLNGTNT
ncbi:MAG: hypothetical protein ACK4UJ_01850 [Leptonema sp. (in: bacteria)]